MSCNMRLQWRLRKNQFHQLSNDPCMTPSGFIKSWDISLSLFLPFSFSYPNLLSTSLPIWWASAGGLTVSLNTDHSPDSSAASFSAPTFPAILGSLGGRVGSTRLSEGGMEGWKHPVLDLPQGGCGPSQTHRADQRRRISWEPGPPPRFFCLLEAGETVEKLRWETEWEGKGKGKEGKTETGV